MHKGNYAILCKLKYAQICTNMHKYAKYAVTPQVFSCAFMHLYATNMQKCARYVSMKVMQNMQKYVFPIFWGIWRDCADGQSRQFKPGGNLNVASAALVPIRLQPLEWPAALGHHHGPGPGPARATGVGSLAGRVAAMVFEKEPHSRVTAAQCKNTYQ